MFHAAVFVDGQLDHAVAGGDQSPNAVLLEQRLPPVAAEPGLAAGLQHERRADAPQPARRSDDVTAVMGQVAHVGAQVATSITLCSFDDYVVSLTNPTRRQTFTNPILGLK